MEIPASLSLDDRGMSSSQPRDTGRDHCEARIWHGSASPRSASKASLCMPACVKLERPAASNKANEKSPSVVPNRNRDIDRYQCKNSDGHHPQAPAHRLEPPLAWSLSRRHHYIIRDKIENDTNLSRRANDISRILAVNHQADNENQQFQIEYLKIEGIVFAWTERSIGEVRCQ
jgi:hypothetical protein